MKGPLARLSKDAAAADVDERTLPASRAANDATGVDIELPQAPAARPGQAPEQHPATLPAPADSSNIVRRSVHDMTALLDEAHHLREELVARGVQTQTINVLVEMAFHGRHDERETLLETAVAASEATYGAGAITRDDLLVHLKQLDDIEKDVQHARRLARQHGLNQQVLNFLTQIIRRNPGDGGAQSVNTFFGYALACGIELDGIADIAQRFEDKPRSVLPDIRRSAKPDSSWSARIVARDIVLGLALAAGLLWLMG